MEWHIDYGSLFDNNEAGDFLKHTKGANLLRSLTQKNREYFINEGYEVALYVNLQGTHANLYCYQRVGQDEFLKLQREYWATERGTVEFTETTNTK